MKLQHVLLSGFLLFILGLLTASVQTIGNGGSLAASYLNTPKQTAPLAAHAKSSSRVLYAVNQSSKDRGSISVYDIDAGHRFIKNIPTVPGIGDVRGVAASAVTGRVYVAYTHTKGIGMIYCLDINTGMVLWDKEVDPGVDRLAINPNGQFIYVPTGEDGSANHINVLDANSGDVVKQIFFSSRSHDKSPGRRGRTNTWNWLDA